MSETLLLTIKYFCYSCSAQTVYFLSLTTFEYFDHPITGLSTKESKASFRMVFLGMGLVSSTAAIHSMVLMEQSIGHRYLEGFNIAQKFLSAKILVSLAFLQQMVLLVPPCSLLSETRQKLLYASAMCLECFLSPFSTSLHGLVGSSGFKRANLVPYCWRCTKVVHMSPCTPNHFIARLLFKVGT